MLIDRTQEPIFRLTIARSRQSRCRGTELADVHREVGRLLARDVARHLPLEEIEIDHVVVKSIDVRIPLGRAPVVVAMLRSGLFIGEGIREALHDASLVLADSARSVDPSDLSQRVVVIADAVINTGASMRRLLAMTEAAGPEKILVAALVGYRPTVASLVEAYPTVDFMLGRISDRSYVGRGGTDTGTRLFGPA